MPKHEIRKACTLCIYFSIISSSSLIVSFFIPQVGDPHVKSVVGFVTLLASVICGFIVARFVWVMGSAKSLIAERLRELFVMKFLICVCTALFGVLGIINAPASAWGLVFVLRAIVAVLEAVAWWLMGKVWLESGSE